MHLLIKDQVKQNSESDYRSSQNTEADEDGGCHGVYFPSDEDLSFKFEDSSQLYYKLKRQHQ